MQKKYSKIKYIFLLLLILLVGAVGVIAIFIPAPESGLPVDLALIPSESVFVLLMLALLLPILLFALIISISVGHKKPIKIEAMPEKKLSIRLDGKKDPPAKHGQGTTGTRTGLHRARRQTHPKERTERADSIC